MERKENQSLNYNKHFIIIHKLTSGLEIRTIKKLKPYSYSGMVLSGTSLQWSLIQGNIIESISCENIRDLKLRRRQRQRKRH